jgi:hypothetical protein
MSRISKDIAAWFPPPEHYAEPRGLNPGLWLKRHPLPINAFFRHSVVLTYAFPKSLLEPLLPPGLVLDTFKEYGFVAIAMVDAQSLRPKFFPRALGQDFFLVGYRIFARYKSATGRTLRGLRILRSDANRSLMVRFGNYLTHYNYRLAAVDLKMQNQRMEIRVQTPRAAANLRVVADFRSGPAPLPEGSPFGDWHEARLFAGPLPFTFDYERETHSIVMIEGVRQDWKPQPIRVEVLENTFFQQPPFAGTKAILANAFHMENIEYQWRRGVREALPKGSK